MKLRTRIAVIVSAVGVAATATGFVIQRSVLLERFLEIERREAVDDVQHCEDELRREVRELASFCGDWSNWDDTYAFIQDGNRGFVDENLNVESMANVRTNAAWFVAADGRLVQAFGHDFDTDDAVEFDELSTGRLPLEHPLLSARSDKECVSGILRSSRGPMLVASRPVLRSDHSGPTVGWFIVGRLLTQQSVTRIGQGARVRLQIHAAGDPTAGPAAKAAPATASAQGDTLFDADDDTIQAFRTVKGLDGRPAMVLHVEVPRQISHEGAQAAAVATATYVISGMTTIGVLVLLLGASVAEPLRRLTAHAERIGRSGDLSSRSGIVRADEIGTLAASFDDMVAKLAESRAQVTEAARRVGMAEVARGVLHNVGNVLTSVNVSAGAVAATVRQSRAEGVLRAIDLVAEKGDDLPRFLAQDARGRILPAFLVESAAALREERAALLSDTEKLQGAMAHAREIVARQRELVAGPAVVERVPLDAAVGACAALVQPAYATHGVTLALHLDSGASVVLDRNRLTQVVVNLLTNAREATLRRGGPDRRVNLRAGVRDGRIRIVVEDNGCGIAPENLARVFASGFSTKQGSLGFGLHYCNVTAKEMGGSLCVASGGPGRGAAFTLDLPAEAGTTAAPRPPSEAVVGSHA